MASVGKGKAQLFISKLPATGTACIPWPFHRLKQGMAFYRGSASRYVCEKFHGPPPTPDHQAAHSCGKGHEGCIAPYHLSWKTVAGNQQDRFEHGTSTRGSQNGRTHLTEEDVKQIRRLVKPLPFSEVARRYKVGISTINSIDKRKSWKHI